jgi:hypothetical protein
MQKLPGKMPRISFWPQTLNINVASYRIRCAQVVEALRQAGTPVTLYSDKISRYFQFLPFMSAPDILVLSKRTRLTSLARAVALKKRYGTKLILDLSDNIYFESDNDKSGDLKKRARLPSYVNQFDLIVTPSPYLENELRRHIRTDMAFHVIPDAVEKDPVLTEQIRREQAKAFQALSDFNNEVGANGVEAGRRLVWFGVAGRPEAQNGMYDLQACCAAFEKHNAEKPLSLSIISDSPERYRELFATAGFSTHYLDWNFFTVNPALKLHDIAVLPIRTNRYTLSKSANRITTAFADGLAVCASLIPSYEPFRGVAVFDDWDDGLATLMADNEQRLDRVEQARAIISQQYSRPVIAAEWQKVFASLG